MTSSPLLDTVRPVPQIAKAHEQVAEHYRQKIRDGDLGAGEEFPSVREIRTEWTASSDTVQRAVRTLREEGWIKFSQGRKPRVVGVPKPP